MHRTRRTLTRTFPGAGRRVKNAVVITDRETGAVVRLSLHRGRREGTVVVSIDTDDRLLVLPEEDGLADWRPDPSPGGTRAEFSAGVSTPAAVL